MTTNNIIENNIDIFSNLVDYAIVGSENSYLILQISNMKFVIIEDNYREIIRLMIERGVKIVENAEELRPKEFKQVHQVWDEKEHIFKTVTQEEFEKLLADRVARKQRK